MRRFDAYRLKKGDNIGDARILNARFDDIDLRIAATEQAAQTVQDVLNLVQAFALERVDAILTPVYAELKTIAEVGAFFTAHSETDLLCGTGPKTLTVIEFDRAKFAPAAYLSVMNGDLSLAMLGSLVAYDRETGVLTISVDRAAGSLTAHDWTVTAASATDNAAAAAAAAASAIEAAGYRNQVVDLSDEVDTDREVVLTSAGAIAIARGETIAAHDETIEARDTTLASLASLAQIYLGAHTTDPTVDNEGGALVIGAVHYNSTDHIQKTYTEEGWVAAIVPIGSEVLTVFGRTGSVGANAGDYDTSKISRVVGATGVAGVTAEAAIVALKAQIDGKYDAGTFGAFGLSLASTADQGAARTTLGLRPGTEVQAYDAALTSLALLGTAAGKIAYTTGIDTWAEAAISVTGRAVIAGADGAAIRGVLDLEPGTDVLAYDADLALIAALPSAADRLPYYSAPGAAALATFTGAARDLLDDADTATMRITLGVRIGTNVQAFDASLTSLALLGTAGDRLAYSTGIDTWAETPITAAARSLLDDADMATMRATLGAGGIGTEGLNTQTANYVLVLADAGKTVEMNSASARTVTVPPQTAVTWLANTVLQVRRLGAGAVTIVAGAGVTLRYPSTQGLLIAHQYSTIYLERRAADEWIVNGDLSA